MMRDQWIQTALYWLACASTDRRIGARRDWAVCMEKVRLARRQIAAVSL